MKLEKLWGRDRASFADAVKAARDIILNCTCKKDDEKFAEKYNYALATVQRIRLGHSWGALRRKLKR